MQHEVIQVIGDAFLISSNWRMCRYVTRDKQPLRPGFYYVLWPSKSKVTSYDQYARCFGPFPRKILADKLKTSAIGLGVINLDSRTPHHDSNRLYSLETKKPRMEAVLSGKHMDLRTAGSSRENELAALDAT